MQIYTKYLTKNLIMPMLVITLTLTGIVWLTQSLRFIDLIVNKGLDISTFLYLSLLLVPSLLFLILPVALFVSVLTVYNKFISDSELIVLKSAGLSRVSLAKPALAVALGVTAITYLISFYLLPNSYKEFKDTQVFIRNNYASVLLQEGVFSNPTKGLTVYIESRGRGGMLYGILVHDSRDPEKPVTIIAEKGVLSRTEHGPRFELINGHSQGVDAQTGNLYILDFESDEYDISMYTEQTERTWKKPEESYIYELLFPEGISEKMRNQFIAEGHYRIVWPLFCIVLTLVALSSLFSGQFNRRGQWKRILAATFITFVITVINLAGKSAAESSPILAVLMYLNIIISGGLCSYVIIANRTITGFPLSDKIYKKLNKFKKNISKGHV
ncbi:MAG: LPS export ABC transporter permease LptF [Alphaproteobacteria bacterium CG11_big_fil_rev_8_21_14_0_20_39_49]|nr:MAG: LPS export ABC transporter permease LptF [Alphaproteobacteria bacterium CG11_big_fil_rev_8_21_14_0_20_39_49]